jgi:hypothetical protein
MDVMSYRNIYGKGFGYGHLFRRARGPTGMNVQVLVGMVRILWEQLTHTG